MKETVRRIMSKVIAPDLATKYNWAGRQGWKAGASFEAKEAFGGLCLCIVIISKLLSNIY